MCEWHNKWGETESITFNLYGIKEPVNALTSFIMMFYVFMYIKTPIFKRDLILAENNINVDNILKYCIIGNLFFSFIAHATYNNFCIKMDGFSMIIPLMFLAWFYNHIYSVFILLAFINKTEPAFIIGIVNVLYITQNKIINESDLIYSLGIVIFAWFMWIIDQKYKSIVRSFWFINLHSFWHIFCTLGLVRLIDNIQW